MYVMVRKNWLFYILEQKGLVVKIVHIVYISQDQDSDPEDTSRTGAKNTRKSAILHQLLNIASLIFNDS
jgi:hypothetical protein